MKQKSLIHEEGVTEARATSGAEELDQNDLGFHLTERMDWKPHGKNLTPNRDSWISEWNYAKGCVCSDVVYELFGRDPWHLLDYHTLPVQKLYILLRLPISGWAELPQEVLSVGRAGGAALGQLLRTGVTQLSRRFRWDTLESEQGGVFIVASWPFGFFFKFYFIWPEVCLFTSHFYHSNGS